MRALVVYESMFGNTAAVAQAVAEGLAGPFEVTLADVHERPSVTGVDLLVVGAPTHAFGLSRPSTRADAVKHGEIRAGARETGIREYLDATPPLAGLPVAAFDTRMDTRFPTGSAARKALRRLHSLGGQPVMPAEDFRVGGMTGPLVDGEIERARRWARQVADRHAASAA
ncbi:flavodoxin domain-containing protein [Actinoplanes hulinensis]|uniref:Flavodoxin domain-containing protein n=1 Tax=Actinoplanes hulinensis TaxID=1144547 RepID=A0ABS7BFF2_9ACTN|nr:flavodoxin domain-containing protein [Actinoplanes hulinensis]MBW6439609.1 flavodoxin domain-containing protein [Actinoplanes hulinensis]